MNGKRCVRVCILLFAFASVTQSFAAFSVAQETGASRSGPRDFDFNIGTWKTHMMYLRHPLSGSESWGEIDGTVVVRKVLDGRALIEEFSADSSEGQYQTLLLRLYDTKTREWSFVFANSGGEIQCARMTGEFKDGRGEFFDREPFDGKMILARTVWSNITAKSHRYEVAFSDDDGKTWEPNLIAVWTREK